MRLLSFDIEDRMKGIGYYEITGGLIGIFITIRMLAYEPALTGINLLLYLLAASLFCFSIYCGNLLRKSNIKGIKLSTWNQILQVFQIKISVGAFIYCSGINVGAGITAANDRVLPELNLTLSTYLFQYTSEGGINTSIIVNLFSLLIIYWLDKLANDIETRKLLMGIL
ncbi:hypothetical protein [Pararcticibacter amylolyticus]|uniref:Uncharacterized protein n=1 Tax=Pararcticibacter amylolyticus TaxID=2173175 RepID=A0A2U2PMR2_9SPHI|nr:hypothetical protein [Pararcticibacter amylolyticus]PWG82687.1 hypothetical protein DDR33_02195 [Pararcticibacter amylolyticus]